MKLGVMSCLRESKGVTSKGVTYISEPQFLSLKVRRVIDF